MQGPCRVRLARANEATMPIMASVTTSALPPSEINGSGSPVTGTSPTTPAMLIKA
jgi:hypothetical protein